MDELDVHIAIIVQSTSVCLSPMNAFMGLTQGTMYIRLLDHEDLDVIARGPRVLLFGIETVKFAALQKGSGPGSGQLPVMNSEPEGPNP